MDDIFPYYVMGYIGKQNEITREKELKVGVRVELKNLEKTIEAIKKVHPYETPGIDIYPLLNEE